MSERSELETLSIHGSHPEGAPPPEPGSPVTPPLVASSTFHGGGPDDPSEARYTRYGNNPTQLRVAAKLAALEGAEDALVLGSGMGAISLALLSLLETGDHVLASRNLYGATRLFMEAELPRRGTSATFVDPYDVEGWRAAIRNTTRVLYLETPTNPTLRLPDPRPLAELGRERGIPLVVDATFATPLNLRPLSLGAEVVVHSATKYLGGHSDLIGGVVCGSRSRIDGVRKMLRLYGPAMDPHGAWLLDRGLRTLQARMVAHEVRSRALARWFLERPGVEEVIHLSLPDHPDRGLIQELGVGPGGMLGVVVSGGSPGADAFCRALRLAAVAPSLGGVETLVSLPRLTSHRSLRAEDRRALGIADGLVRISIGLEGVEDLKRDFQRGLDAVGGVQDR